MVILAVVALGCTRGDGRLDVDSRQAKTDVIIVTDCGAEVDDQWMLLHFARSDEFNILAVLSSHCGGCESLERPQAESSFREIQTLFEYADVEGVRVISGSNSPLSSTDAIVPRTADLLFALVEPYSRDNRVTIVVSGAATDVASALVKYPEMEGKIEIVATAFYSTEIGMSFNVYSDLVAWQIILGRNVLVTVAPNPVSQRAFAMSRTAIDTVLDADGKIDRYLRASYNSWLDSHEAVAVSVTGDKDSWPIWDEILVAHMLGLTKTELWQRPILLADGTLDYNQASDLVPIEWIVEADHERTWEDFQNAVK